MTEQMNVPKLRFGEFEGKWHQLTLKQVSTKNISYGVVQTGDKDLTVPCVRVVDLTSGSLDKETFIKTSESISQSYKKTVLERGELMVALRGVIGLTRTVPIDLVGCNLTRGIARISPDQNSFSSQFVEQVLNTPKSTQRFDQLKNGSALKEISIGELNKYTAVYPTLPEQQKIASFLSKVDEKIGLLSEKKDKLTEYKRGVMQQLFNGKWHEQDGQLTFVPPTLRFKADDGCEFPDWEEKTLGDVSNHITYGLTVRPNFVENGIPLISAREITSGVPMYNKAPMISSETFDKLSSKAKPQVGDIFLSKTGTIGFSAMHTLSSKVAITQNIAVIRITEPNLVSADYVLHYLKTTSFLKSAIARVNQSTIMDLQLGDIKKLRLPLPSSVAEQQKVAQFISKIDQKIGLANTELETTKEWKKGLLQQMFV